MADVSKVKINNTLYDIKDQTKVSKSGDTMTGALTESQANEPYVRMKRTNVTLGTAPLSDTPIGSYQFVDNGDTILGYIASIYTTDKINVLRLSARNGLASNILDLKVAHDNTLSIGFSSPETWRNALGLGDSGWLTATNAAKFSGTVYYRKIGKLVQVNAYDITLTSGLSASGNVSLGDLIPSGYRPSKVTTFPIRWHSDSKTSTGLLNASGGVYVNAPDATAVTTSSTLCFTATYFID